MASESTSAACDSQSDCSSSSNNSIYRIGELRLGTRSSYVRNRNQFYSNQSYSCSFCPHTFSSGDWQSWHLAVTQDDMPLTTDDGLFVMLGPRGQALEPQRLYIEAWRGRREAWFAACPPCARFIDSGAQQPPHPGPPLLIYQLSVLLHDPELGYPCDCSTDSSSDSASNWSYQ